MTENIGYTEDPWGKDYWGKVDGAWAGNKTAEECTTAQTRTPLESSSIAQQAPRPSEQIDSTGLVYVTLAPETDTNTPQAIYRESRGEPGLPESVHFDTAVFAEGDPAQILPPEYTDTTCAFGGISDVQRPQPGSHTSPEMLG